MIDPQDFKNPGELIKFYRKRLKMTYVDIEGASGVPARTVRDWVHSGRSPSLTAFMKVCRALKIPIEDVIEIAERE